MTIDKTIQQLGIFEEIARETLADDMSEAPLVAISEEDVRAIQTALVVLRGLRIMNGVFKEEDT